MRDVNQERFEGHNIRGDEGHDLDGTSFLRCCPCDADHAPSAVKGDEDQLVLGVDVGSVSPLIPPEEGIDPFIGDALERVRKLFE